MNVRSMCVLWLCGIAPGLIGCSKDDLPTPREQCLVYQSAFCDKANECAEPSERGDLREACEFLWQVYAICDEVTGVVNPQYDSCLQAIHAIPCSTVPSGSVPDSPTQCRGIFVGSQ